MSDTVASRLLDYSEIIHGMQRNSAVQIFG